MATAVAQQEGSLEVGWNILDIVVSLEPGKYHLNV